MNRSAPAFRRGALPTAAALAYFVCVPPASAADKPARGAAGRLAAGADTLLERPERGRWQAVRGTEVPAGDTLLALPTDRPVVDLDGGIRLTLWGNDPAHANVPVWESAVSIKSAGPEAELGLERGRIVLANRNEKADATVRVHFRDKAWRLTLEPSTEMSVEVYSRWAPGTFRREPGPDDVPTTVVVINALKGHADVQADGEHFRMGAAPGPAYYHWDNVGTQDRSPKHRDRAPDWLGAADDPRFRFREGTVDQALAQALAAPSAERRRLAVFGLATIDDLPRTVDALTDARYADIRDAAVLALRHWIGRGVREDQALYQFLIRQRGYSAGQAEIVMQLLHGLTEEHDRAQPETYEALIAYLLHDKPAVRAVAIWQLLRWVPQGKDIAYNPGGTDAERRRGSEAWKKLVPAGKLPPRPGPSKQRG